MTKKIYKNKKILGFLLMIAVVVVGGAAYIKLSNHPSGTDATTQNTSAPKQYAATSGGNSPSTTQPASKGSAASTPTAASLPAPSGQLLNKQTISLSSSAPQTNADLESICQTLANASCDINLTSTSGQVKTVGAQNTGSSGNVIFDWNAKTLGLTTGKWTVQAVVVQSNASGTSHSEYLEVQP